MAAKLSRYNGELCELPVTYVNPNEDLSSPSESSLCKETQSQLYSDNSTVTSPHVEDKTKGTSSTICSPESLPSGSESVPKSSPSELPLCKETQSHQRSDILMDSSSRKENQSEGLSSAICSPESLSSNSESVPKTLIQQLQSIIRDRGYRKLCPAENNSDTHLSKEHAHVLECAASS